MICIPGDEVMRGNLDFQQKLKLLRHLNTLKISLGTKLHTSLAELTILLPLRVRKSYMVGESPEWVNLALKQKFDIFILQFIFLSKNLMKQYLAKDQVKFQ